MNSRIKAFRVLVRLRKQQGDRLRAQLSAAQALLSERQADEASAATALMGVERAHHQSEAERNRMLDGAFTPAGLRALEFRIEELRCNVGKAQDVLRVCREALRRQEATVAESHKALQRNERQIEAFEDRIKRIAQEDELTLEEATEEEVNEAAAGRYIAARRSTAQSE